MSANPFAMLGEDCISGNWKGPEAPPSVPPAQSNGLVARNIHPNHAEPTRAVVDAVKSKGLPETIGRSTQLGNGTSATTMVPLTSAVAFSRPTTVKAAAEGKSLGGPLERELPPETRPMKIVPGELRLAEPYFHRVDAPSGIPPAPSLAAAAAAPSSKFRPSTSAPPMPSPKLGTLKPPAPPPKQAPVPAVAKPPSSPIIPPTVAKPSPATPKSAPHPAVPAPVAKDAHTKPTSVSKPETRVQETKKEKKPAQSPDSPSSSSGPDGDSSDSDEKTKKTKTKTKTKPVVLLEKKKKKEEQKKKKEGSKKKKARRNEFILEAEEGEESERSAASSEPDSDDRIQIAADDESSDTLRRAVERPADMEVSDYECDGEEGGVVADSDGVIREEASAGSEPEAVSSSVEDDEPFEPKHRLKRKVKVLSIPAPQPLASRILRRVTTKKARRQANEEQSESESEDGAPQPPPPPPQPKKKKCIEMRRIDVPTCIVDMEGGIGQDEDDERVLFYNFLVGGEVARLLIKYHPDADPDVRNVPQYSNYARWQQSFLDGKCLETDQDKVSVYRILLATETATYPDVPKSLSGNALTLLDKLSGEPWTTPSILNRVIFERAYRSKDLEFILSLESVDVSTQSHHIKLSALVAGQQELLIDGPCSAKFYALLHLIVCCYQPLVLVRQMLFDYEMRVRGAVVNSETGRFEPEFITDAASLKKELGAFKPACKVQANALYKKLKDWLEQSTAILNSLQK